jgi:electron transport complex protein RnfB
MSVELEVIDVTKGKPPRKKVPPVVAVIEQAGCTGCEACIAFCPVDCIEIVPGLHHPDMNKLVEVDLDRCIGCKLCAKYCPWETIIMYDYEEGLEKAPGATIRSVCDQAAELEGTA